MPNTKNTKTLKEEFFDLTEYLRVKKGVSLKIQAEKIATVAASMSYPRIRSLRSDARMEPFSAEMQAIYHVFREELKGYEHMPVDEEMEALAQRLKKVLEEKRAYLERNEKLAELNIEWQEIVIRLQRRIEELEKD